MIKLTKPQRKLFFVIGDKSMKLGDISQAYFKDTPLKRGVYSSAMRRNSKMASWLVQLEEKGLIAAHWSCGEYPLTDIVKEFIKEG